jgi:hypothetical protein
MYFLQIKLNLWHENKKRRIIRDRGSPYMCVQVFQQSFLENVCTSPELPFCSFTVANISTTGSPQLQLLGIASLQRGKVI